VRAQGVGEGRACDRGRAAAPPAAGRHAARISSASQAHPPLPAGDAGLTPLAAASAEEGTRESADAKCRRLTASWVREAAAAGDESIEQCSFFEGYERAGGDALLEAGVYTMHDLRAHGRKRGWCPYFLARHGLGLANVVVFNYQYLIDPKVSAVVSRELEKECVVVFDEAHNIDNVCIEALSVNLRGQTLDAAGRNIGRLTTAVATARQANAGRLQAEYQRLVAGLAAQGAVRGGEEWLANPALPDDLLAETVPGNIRRAEHFIAFLKRFVAFLRDKLARTGFEHATPAAFLAELAERVAIDAKTLRFCYDRLASLMKTLEIADTDEYGAVHLVADFATLVGTYSRGFAVITEPYDERLPAVPDPIIQLCCLDASLAMKPIFGRFQTVVITSGTLSPIELYPRILDFRPVSVQSFAMTLTRDCLCPVVLTRGADQMPVSTKFDMRGDAGVVRNYGRRVAAPLVPPPRRPPCRWRARLPRHARRRCFGASATRTLPPAHAPSRPPAPLLSPRSLLRARAGCWSTSRPSCPTASSPSSSPTPTWTPSSAAGTRWACWRS